MSFLFIFIVFSLFDFLFLFYKRFANETTSQEIEGSLFAKSPYSTNSNGPKLSTKDIHNVHQFVDKLAKDMLFNTFERRLRLPYIMIQPTMKYRREYKLVFFGGKFVHFYRPSNTLGNGPAFSFGNHQRLIDFATSALALFKQTCPYAVVSGLFRVDVMQSQCIEEFEPADGDMNSDFMKSFHYWKVDGSQKFMRQSLRVNEFESIQADHSPSEALEHQKTLYWFANLETQFKNMNGRLI